MTITSVGYSGSANKILDTQWAQIAERYSAAPVVVSGCDVTVTSAVNRTVKVADGVLQGHGVQDTIAGEAALTLGSKTGTTPRWDAIVAHRDWQASPSGITTLTVVPGAVSSTAPVYPAALAATPGTAADQVLALVPVTQTGAGTPVPVSFYTGGAPVYWNRDDDTGMNPGLLPYGTMVVQFRAGKQSDLFIRRGTDAAPVLECLNDPDWTDLTPDNGAANTSGIRAMRARICGGHLELSGSTQRANGNLWTPSNGYYSVAPIPSALRPTYSRACPGTCDTGAVVRVSFDRSDNYLKVRVFGTTTDVVHLDGVRFPIH